MGKKFYQYITASLLLLISFLLLGNAYARAEANSQYVSQTGDNEDAMPIPKKYLVEVKIWNDREIITFFNLCGVEGITLEPMETINSSIITTYGKPDAGYMIAFEPGNLTLRKDFAYDIGNFYESLGVCPFDWRLLPNQKSVDNQG